MCRFALYLGNEISISSLITEPANSIIHQSFHSHERQEPLNGDGFGIAWYFNGHEKPAVFRDITPAWNNLNLVNLASVTQTSCLLAHVRAATPGLPVQQLNCHPFSSDRFAFMHNGTVGGFSSVRRALLNSLSDESFEEIKGSTDSEHVFGLILDQIERSREAPLEAMKEAVRYAISETERFRELAHVSQPSQLNLALSDGHRAVVSRFASDDSEPPNSLYVHSGSMYICEKGLCHMAPSEGKKTAVIVASEPLSEDEGWTPIPPNHLVVVDDSLSVTIEEI